LNSRIQAYPQQEFDTKTLKQIAKLTKGEYYRVRDTDKLRDTFRSIDQLEKTDVTQNITIRRKELFPWFAAAALLCAIIALTIQSLNPPPAP
jgi:Ca-activated chloride channel family protein